MGVEKCLPLVLLFLSSGVPTNAQKAEVTAEAPPAETALAVVAGAPLTVECWLRVEQRAEWRLDGGAPPGDLRAAAEGAPSGGWVPARLRAAAARRAHGGLYTCARGPDARAVRVRVSDADADAAAAEPAAATTGGGVAAAAGGADGDLYFEVFRALTLNCTSDTVDDVYTWMKNGTEVTRLADLKGRFELLENQAVFKVKQSQEDDFGNYTCNAKSGWTVEWQVRGKPHARLARDTNVVEGQKLKLQCKVVGKPHPVVTWLFRNVSGAEGGAQLEESERLRFEAGESGVQRATLVLEAAQHSDAGEYVCVPGERGVPAATTLRVKDMYAALWPFLGICAEVFVLCAIILVYEKRRTKPELDDSDTDNHDQKKS